MFYFWATIWAAYSWSLLLRLAAYSWSWSWRDDTQCHQKVFRSIDGGISPAGDYDFPVLGDSDLRVPAAHHAPSGKVAPISAPNPMSFGGFTSSLLICNGGHVRNFVPNLCLGPVTRSIACSGIALVLEVHCKL